MVVTPARTARPMKDDMHRARKHPAAGGATSNASDRVRLEVSILEPEPRKQSRPDEAASGSGTARTVLVVAVETDLRAYVRECLERDGLRVLEAMDGVSLRAGLDATGPDLCVLDAGSADAEALSIWRTLARDARARVVPLVVLSDEPVEDSVVRANGLMPPAVVLVKPFNALRLCGEVARLLDGHPRPSR